MSCKTKTQEMASTAKSPWGKPPVRSLPSYSKSLTQQHQQANKQGKRASVGESAPVQRDNAQPRCTSPFSYFAVRGILSSKKVPTAHISRIKLTSVALGATASHAGCTRRSCLHLCSPPHTGPPAHWGTLTPVQLGSDPQQEEECPELAGLDLLVRFS